MLDSNNTGNSQNDRFGISEKLMCDEFKQHADINVFRSGCYVPNRKEVMTLAPEKLIDLLNDWFWESPSSLIPTDEQERQVIELLMQRPDSAAFEAFIKDAPSYPKLVFGADKTVRLNLG